VLSVIENVRFGERGDLPEPQRGGMFMGFPRPARSLLAELSIAIEQIRLRALDWNPDSSAPTAHTISARGNAPGRGPRNWGGPKVLPICGAEGRVRRGMGRAFSPSGKRRRVPRALPWADITLGLRPGRPGEAHEVSPFSFLPPALSSRGPGCFGSAQQPSGWPACPEALAP